MPDDRTTDGVPGYEAPLLSIDKDNDVLKTPTTQPSLFPDGALEEHSELLALRVIEALLFAAGEPLSEALLATRLPEGSNVPVLMERLGGIYAGRGVNLVRVAGRWAFRTAPDLAYLLREERIEPKRLSRAALETLSIIAYHQPVTRAEVEEIRGVSLSKGTLDVLLEIGWVRMRGRRKVPGRPITYGTSDAFLEHFGLDTLSDLPGVDEMKAAGLLESTLPPGFSIPQPSSETGHEDEDPLEADEPG